MKTPRKHRGPAFAPGTPGQKSTLGVRVSSALKERLNEEANRNDRSLSQEAELRLEQSFRDERVVEQVLALSPLGPQLAALLSIIGRVASDTGQHAAFMSSGRLGARDWFDDPFAFAQVATALETVIKAFRPIGEVAYPQVDEGNPAATSARLGEMIAGDVLEAVKDPERRGEIGNWARPIREKLGATADRLRIEIVGGVSPGWDAPSVVSVTYEKKGGQQ